MLVHPDGDHIAIRRRVDREGESPSPSSPEK